MLFLVILAATDLWKKNKTKQNKTKTTLTRVLVEFSVVVLTSPPPCFTKFSPLGQIPAQMLGTAGSCELLRAPQMLLKVENTEREAGRMKGRMKRKQAHAS